MFSNDSMAVLVAAGGSVAAAQDVVLQCANGASSGNSLVNEFSNSSLVERLQEQILTLERQREEAGSRVSLEDSQGNHRMTSPMELKAIQEA